MTAGRSGSRRKHYAVFVFFLLAVCAGSSCSAVSVSGTEQVESQAASSEDPGKVLEGGPWLLLEVKGAVVQLSAGEKQPYILFQRQERRVKGFSGCNEFSGSCDLRGDALTFGLLAMTRRYCAGAAGEVEREFVDVLSKIRTFRIEGGMLLFLEGDKAIARLRQERRNTQQ